MGGGVAVGRELAAHEVAQGVIVVPGTETEVVAAREEAGQTDVAAIEVIVESVGTLVVEAVDIGEPILDRSTQLQHIGPGIGHVGHHPGVDAEAGGEVELGTREREASDADAEEGGGSILGVEAQAQLHLVVGVGGDVELQGIGRTACKMVLHRGEGAHTVDALDGAAQHVDSHRTARVDTLLRE